MNPRLREAFEREMFLGWELERSGAYDEAFIRLERAHVLGQREVVPHTRTHWRMLAIALRRRDLRAACGQAVRIVLGALGSALGRVPVGNTGGTDISMFARLPIDPELAKLLDDPGRRAR